MKDNYIYLLKLREFIKTNENIYKVGRTCRPNLTRFKNYPNGSQLVFQMLCYDCVSLEKKILENFMKNPEIIFRKDIGNEYFEGDYKLMADIIYRTIYEEPKIEEIQVNAIDDKEVVVNNAPNIDYLQQLNLLEEEKNIKQLETIEKPKKLNIKKYKCLRCGLLVDRQNKLLRHYNRIDKCYPKYIDIPTAILKEVIDEKDDLLLKTILKGLDVNLYNKYLEYIVENINIVIEKHKQIEKREKFKKKNKLDCKYCGEYFSSYSSRLRHENHYCNKKQN